MTTETLQALLPGATVGVIGGGQLGRYFVLEARRLGYRSCVLDPDSHAPAMQVAEIPVIGAYDDAQALDRLAELCDAVTVEFENVPAASLERIDRATRVAPSASAIRVAQDRNIEKQTAAACGLQPVPFALIETTESISPAIDAVGLPAILKTTRLGYDGKGQARCHTATEVRLAFDQFQSACVLEQEIKLAAEVSVILARGFDGSMVHFPVAKNVHENGILATSTVPADIEDTLSHCACQLAEQLAEGIGYQGVMAVEFFVDDTGDLYFNEMAPRPHNSGHYTLDATVTSQFEQQLRALCALPLGSTRLLSPVCMVNVLGELWGSEVPNWSKPMSTPGAQLHLYGKSEARPGRKMGHINCLAETAEDARATALFLRDGLDAR